MGHNLRLPLLVSGALNLFLLQHLGLVPAVVAVSCGFGLIGALVWDELLQRERDAEQ